MGDRVVVFFKSQGRSSPGVYLHWHGSEAIKMIRAATAKLRRGDSGYSAARFCGYCHTQLQGNTGLGLLPAPATEDEAGYSALADGDAGAVVVDVDTGAISAYAGYLADKKIKPLNIEHMPR